MKATLTLTFKWLITRKTGMLKAFKIVIITTKIALKQNHIRVTEYEYSMKSYI